MRNGLGEQLQLWAERGAQHPYVPIRRAMQLVVTISVVARAIFRFKDGPSDALLVERISSSRRVRDYLDDRTLVRRAIGYAARRYLLAASAHAKKRRLNANRRHAFVLKIGGSINQEIVRNLLLWREHVLIEQAGSVASESADRSIDLILDLTACGSDEARVYDMISVGLMLRRVSNFAFAWTADDVDRMVRLYMSAKEQEEWFRTRKADDLGRLPLAAFAKINSREISSGVSLLLDGRKRAQDFFKAAFRGKLIVAVAVRENEEGASDHQDLRMWLDLFADVAAKQSELAFMVLNRAGPSQWQTWPGHIRWPRHEGLSLQDCLCVAQLADAFVGVLDVFGLAAKGAGVPGVYVALNKEGRAEHGRGNPGSGDKAPQIIVDVNDRVKIADAIRRWLAAAET